MVLSNNNMFIEIHSPIFEEEKTKEGRKKFSKQLGMELLNIVVNDDNTLSITHGKKKFKSKNIYTKNKKDKLLEGIYNNIRKIYYDKMQKNKKPEEKIDMSIISQCIRKHGKENVTILPFEDYTTDKRICNKCNNNECLKETWYGTNTKNNILIITGRITYKSDKCDSCYWSGYDGTRD